MTIILDHLVLQARDHEDSARFFANVMGLEYKGVDTQAPHFAPVRLNEFCVVVFTPSATTQSTHLGFHIDQEKFEQIRHNLDQAKVRYGNSPRDPQNGRTDHPFGGNGLFFSDSNGHFFEVFTQKHG